MDLQELRDVQTAYVNHIAPLLEKLREQYVVPNDDSFLRLIERQMGVLNTEKGHLEAVVISLSMNMIKTSVHILKAAMKSAYARNDTTAYNILAPFYRSLCKEYKIKDALEKELSELVQAPFQKYDQNLTTA